MIFKIAFRNIFRQKRRTILTALSMLSGFVLSAFFIGFSDGSYSNIINMFTKNKTGHIQIHQKDYLDNPSIYKSISKYQIIFRKFDKIKGIESYTPRIYTSALVSVRDKSAGARIIGISPEFENRTTNFNLNIVKGGKPLSKNNSKETLIGIGLSKLLKTKIGEKVTIVSQGADGAIAYDEFKIIGLIDSGDELADKMAFYIHFMDADKLFSLKGKIHEIAINTKNIRSVDMIKHSISKSINNTELTVATWKEFAKSFYDAMKADQAGMWIMLFIIVLIVAVGVLNTVLMSVLERTREYGVLKAVGTKPKQIFSLVLIEVNIIAIFSVIIGTGIGFILNSLMAKYGYNIPEPISYGGMMIETMKGEVNLRSFVIPAITIFFTASFVGFFPALRAAKIDPAKSMRSF